MQRIYLDNAATTAMDQEVIDAMLPYLTEKFGNPSSIYSYGRETKMAIEAARKTVANCLGVKPAEIFFTSGGTESSNTAIQGALRDLNCKRIISSPIEHHATLHSVETYAKQYGVPYHFVNILPNGHIDIDHLAQLLSEDEGRALVTLMHANNEIGNLLDVERVGELCAEHDAIFHCDTVQTVGHYPLDLSKLNIHFATGASHKFHGPKGVGILYINANIKVSPYLQGGAQERNMRAGTENTYGIVGFAKALELAMQRYEIDSKYIADLKSYMIEQLEQHIPDVRFNGDYKGRSLYTVLNASFPKTEKSEMLLFNLDVAGICVSSGSACSSGTNKGSHVIGCLPNTEDRVSIRFSFCRKNTKEEIDIAVAKIKSLL